MPSQRQDYLVEKQLDGAFDRLRFILGSFPVVGLAVCVPLRSRIATQTLALWLLALVCVAMLGLHLGRRYQSQSVKDLRRWSLVRMACACVNGSVWGGVLGTVLLVPEDPVLVNYVAFVVGGTSAAALVSSASHLPSLCIFELANNLPLVIRLLGEGTEIHRAMAALTLVFVLVILLVARRLGANVRTLILTEAENRELVAELRQAHQALSDANATLQQKVHEQTRQLQLAQQEREAQQAQLHRAERMEAVGRLAGGVAHDFNNILTGISGFASLIHDSLAADDERREDAREILAATERAAQLTRQLLSFAKGAGVTQPHVVDLALHLRAIERMLKRVVPENIELLWSLPEAEAFLVLIDPVELDQLVMNLVINARDAMPQGGRIEIRAVRESAEQTGEETGLLTVTDTGPGIPPNLLDRVFEPFVSTKGDRGTGLGLTTCFGIVNRARGTIVAKSEPGRGASFEVRLPLTAQANQSQSPVWARRAPWRARQGLKALAVENEAAILKMVARTLEQGGFQVYPVTSAEQALELVSGGLIPDVVVTDVILTRMSGIELRDTLRKGGSTAPVLLISGYLDEVNLRRMELGERVSALAKPFTAEGLLAAVSRALEQPAP